MYYFLILHALFTGLSVAWPPRLTGHGLADPANDFLIEQFKQQTGEKYKGQGLVFCFDRFWKYWPDGRAATWPQTEWELEEQCIPAIGELDICIPGTLESQVLWHREWKRDGPRVLCPSCPRDTELRIRGEAHYDDRKWHEDGIAPDGDQTWIVIRLYKADSITGQKTWQRKVCPRLKGNEHKLTGNFVGGYYKGKKGLEWEPE